MSTATTARGGTSGSRSTSRPRRLAWVAAALVVQIALVGVAVAPQLSARIAGDDYRLAVAPVDPVDPFRGAYVDLGYPGLPSPRNAPGSEGVEGVEGPIGTVYVPLLRDDAASGELWKGTGVNTAPPVAGPYLRCENQGWRLNCGIESWFVPQDRAYEIEQAMRGQGAVATVRIDSAGRATIVDLHPAR